MALVAHFDWELHQIDVKTTFLNSNLNERFLWCNLKDFMEKGKEYLLCRLKKSFYRLKQASHQWYLKFDEDVTSLSFVENKIDQCIYFKVNGCKFILFILYVDDILLVSSDLSLLNETKFLISKNFDMKEFEEASFILEIEIHRDRSISLFIRSFSKDLYWLCACQI